MKRSFFPTKQPSKGSSVDVKCNYEEPQESFPPKVRKHFVQSLEIEKKNLIFSEKGFFPKCSSGHVAVWRSYQKLSAKSWINFLLIVQKWWGEN